MSMQPSNQQPVSVSLDFQGLLRKRLEAIAIKDLAVDTGIDGSQLSKFILNHAALKLDDVAKLVKRAGLKCVDAQRTCVRPEELAFLRRIHALVNEHAPWLLNESES